MLHTDGLGMKFCWSYFHKGSVSNLINELMSNKGVCRTATATSGLLKKEEEKATHDMWQMTCDAWQVTRDM